MSPTEKELRAALRRGEGEVPDPAGLMAHARAVQRQRRARIMSAAAAVIVVGGVAGGATWLGHDRSNPSAAAGPDRAAATHHSVPDFGGPMTPITHAPLRSTTPASPAPQSLGSAASGCSARPVQYLLPGGGSSEFGADGALVSKPVRSILICAYVPASGGQQVYSKAVKLTGPAATTLADSLNRPDSGSVLQPCAVVRPGTLVLHPVATDGTRLTPVTITMMSCSFRATDGIALRTRWFPPDGQYSTLLEPLNAGTVGVAPPGGTVRASGSPVH